MPIYEYQCTKCNDRTEVIQKFTDPPYAVCDKCGGDVRKLMSAPAIQFKGSGFYKNDYASAASKAETKAGSETKSESSSDSKPSETKSESKSETKSEAKAETKSPSKTESKSSD
jgi:putative FmdB family regulatory protein